MSRLLAIQSLVRVLSGALLVVGVVGSASAVTIPHKVDSSCPKVEGVFQVQGLVCGKAGGELAFFELNPTGYFPNWMIFSQGSIEVVLSGPKGEIPSHVRTTQTIESCEAPTGSAKHPKLLGTLEVSGVEFDAAAVKRGRRHALSWSEDGRHPDARVPALPRTLDIRTLARGFRSEQPMRLEASGNLYLGTDWRLEGSKPEEGICLLKLAYLSDRDGKNRQVGSQ